MQISIKKESLQIVISDATAEECISVLQGGLLSEIISLNAKRLIEDGDSLNIEEYQEDHADTLEEKIEAIQVGVEVPRKKLVFNKCTGCDRVSCRMIDTEVESHKVRCACGTYDHINTSDLVLGKYKCDCETTGHFLMTKDVDKIYCKGCNTPIYMTKDEHSDHFIGQSFKALMQKL